MVDRTKDIDDAMSTLTGAYLAEAAGDAVNPNEVVGPLVVLLGGALLDLNRIADAVEKLQLSNPDPSKPLSLRELNPAETRVITALRDGTLTITQLVESGDYYVSGSIPNGK